MSYKKVELELYTAMNEYNKYGDDFNKVIINHIYNVVTERTKVFEDTLGKVSLDGIDTLLLKYSEVSNNCNLLLIDLNNTNKINNLKRSIEELDIFEVNIQKNAYEIIEKLNLGELMQSTLGIRH